MQVAEDTRLASAANLQKKFFPKFRKNNVVYAAPTDIWVDFTSMNSHVKSYALKYMISGNFFSQSSLKVKTRQRHLVNFNFPTSVTFFSGLGPVQVAVAASARHGPGYQSTTLNLVVI